MKHIKRDLYRPKACVRKQLFQNMVMLHIRFKGIINEATWKQIFYPQTPTPLPSQTLGVRSKSQNSFSEHGHVAYQIKGNGA